MKGLSHALWLFAWSACRLLGAVSVYAPESVNNGLPGTGPALGVFNGEAYRFQQVYASTLFSAFPMGTLIYEVDFRSDEFLPYAGFLTVSNIEIHLSTTTKPVDGLSPVFAENVGADDRVVRSTAPFTLSVAGSAMPFTVPAIFSSAVVLNPNNPFYYNPAAGNLLLDVRISRGFAGVGTFDAINLPGDSVSTVYSTSFPASSVADMVGTIGLATRFAVDPIPEPSSWAIGSLGIGLVLLFGGKGIRRKRKPYVTS